MRFFLFILIILFTGITGFSQEILTGLHTNPMVKAKAATNSQAMYPEAGYDTIPVTIPFFDDFSANGVFPSHLRWIDNYAFENNDIPVNPVNMGAITLDASNDSGNMYRNAVAGPETFIADHLTSRYIRLDSVFTPVPHAITPADSVYLSFFYQPQGRGRAPQKADSLILQFLLTPAHDSIIPGDTIKIPDTWQKMWYANGMTLDTFFLKNNHYFVQVLIPVTDPVFLRKKFRFRFYNYVSLAGSSEPSWQSNTNQWNLDNVYLNRGRSLHDTVYPELRFITPPPSLLKRYQSMPYPQYCNDPTNEIRDTLDILMSNRDILPHMSNYSYYLTEPGGSYSKTYNGGNYNILPYATYPYVTYQKFAHPEFHYLLPVGAADSATFLIKHVVKDITAGSAIGDTMQAYQNFYNYFAYDDGTPEASYGLSPAGSQLAIRFKLNKSPDTLRAVRMFFNPTLSNASKQNFLLCVWNDNAGKPGDTLFSNMVTPEYADSLNQFVTYPIYPPVRITGTFYVGWIQTTSDNLSIGFDRNNNSQAEIFINTTGSWYNSAYTGSVMIRPVVGKPLPLGIRSISPGSVKLFLYPNPCAGVTLHVSVPGTLDLQTLSSSEITVSDLVGHAVLKTSFRNELDVSSLDNGIYFLEFHDHSHLHHGVSKFIISR
ncbi:MAG: T9SS type A sorting domain-containing protein [Bacteroidota bacterium]